MRSCHGVLLDSGVSLSWDRVLPLFLAIVPHDDNLTVEAAVQFNFE